MKILSPQNIRELDDYSLKNENITSLELMERACNVFTQWFIRNFDTSHKVKIFCGMGNNGGDGLGIGRLLIEQKYNAKIYILENRQKGSDDFQYNLEKITSPKWIRELIDIPRLNPDDIIIDAIFGSGLNRPTSGISAEAIDVINKSGCTIISVDIASGLFSDVSNHSEFIIEPTYTFSFQLPKLSFLFPENEKYVGNWVISNIGLNQEFIDKTETDYFFSDENFVKTLYKKRSKFSHKGTFGHAFIMAGSLGKMGAAVLAAKACLRTGAGLLTIHSPQCGTEILQISIPEAMVEEDIADNYLSQLPDLEKFNAIGVGPGIGLHPMTCEILENLLREIKVPIVIDADGLNIISQFKALLNKLPSNTILTPHPKEFERLTGEVYNNHSERLNALKEFCLKHKVIVVLKGHNTAIGLPSGKIYFNSTGNSSMATGGTGDALTGIITSLLAQKYETENAAILGVYLHGKAGDLIAEKQGFSGLLARDLIDAIPFAIKTLEN